MELKSQGTLAIVLPAWAVLNFAGCSLIGLGLGAALDGAIPDVYVFSQAGVDSIRPGEYVNILKTDGTTVSGEFVGLETPADGTYPVRYRQFVAASSIGESMPALGDSIFVVTHGALGPSMHSGKFLGFAQAALRLESAKYGRPVGVLVEYIDTVRCASGKRIIGDTLRQHMACGEVPAPVTVTRMLVAREPGTTALPVNLIRQVQVPGSNNRKWWGLGVGLLLDAASVYAWYHTPWTN